MKKLPSAATLRQGSAATLRQSPADKIWKKLNTMLKQKILTMTNRSMILLLFLLTTVTVFSQPKQSTTDSLAQLLSSSIQEDSNKVKLLLEYYRCFLPANPDSALKISQQALDISTKINYHVGIIKGFNCTAACYRQQNNPDMAIPTFQKALALAVNDKNSYLQTLVSFNLGAYYETLGISDSAVKYHKMAINAGKTLADKTLYAESLLCTVLPMLVTMVT